MTADQIFIILLVPAVAAVVVWAERANRRKQRPDDAPETTAERDGET